MAKATLTVNAKGNAEKKLKNISAAMIGFNQGLELAKKAADALIDPLKSIVEEGAAFEQALADTAAVSQDFQKNLDLVAKKAKAIGAATEFSSVQAAKAFEELARAGVAPHDAIESIESVMSLASATGADLATSASTVATTLGIFAEQGLEAEKAVNLMVKTVGASPQNFDNLKEALKTSQGTAATLGIEFEDLTVILGTMSKAGFKGEQAGTALNGALAKLANLKDSNTVLQDLGLTAEELDPKLNDFRDIIEKLSSKGAGLTETIKLLGQEAGTKFARLVQQGGAAFDDFAKAQSKANSASEASEIRLDTLTGKYKLLESATSGAKVKIFKENEKELTKTTVFITNFVNNYRKIFKLLVTGLKKQFQSVGKALSKVNKLIVLGFQNILSKASIIFEGIGFIISTTFNGVMDFFTTELVNGFDRGWKSIKKAALQAILDIAVAIEKLGVNFNNAWDVIVQDTASAILSIVNLANKIPGINIDTGPLEETLKEVDKKIQDSMKKTSTALDSNGVFAPVINELETLKKESTKPAKSFEESFAGSSEAIETEIKRINGAYETIGETAKTNGELIGAAFAEITSPDEFKEINKILAAGTEIIEKTETAVRKVAKSETAFKNKAKETLKALTKQEKIEKKILAIALKNAKAEGKRAKARAKASEYASGLGEQVAGQVVGVSGAIQGFQQAGPLGAIAGFFTELLLSNEKFREQINRLNKKLSELLDPIVEAIIPIFDELVVILDELKPTIKIIGHWLGELVPWLIKLSNVLSPFQPALVKLNAVLERLETVFDAMAPTWDAISGNLEGVEASLDAVKDALIASDLGISSLVGVLDEIKNYIVQLAEFIFQNTKYIVILNTSLAASVLVLTALVRVVQKLIETMGGGKGANIGGSFVGAVVGAISGGFDDLSPEDQKKRQMISDTGSLYDVPSRLQKFKFHDGGNIGHDNLINFPGAKSNEGLIIAKEGETVLPPGSTGGGGMTFNINAISPNEVKEEILQLIEESIISGRLVV